MTYDVLNFFRASIGEDAINVLDRIVLLVTGLIALYLVWRFWGRFKVKRGLYDIYYMMGFLFFSQALVLTILGPLLLLMMTLAFAWGFVKDIKATA